MNSQSRTPPSPPSADLPNLDLDSAKALLIVPYEALLSMRFYSRDNNEGIAGFWGVDCINRKTTRNGSSVAFEVVFENLEENFEMHEQDVIEMLLNSCACEGMKSL
jgi:hypothetical protein